jgi:hypothetical protein
MGHFVKAETVRLDLSDGAYILIKKRLNHGEQEDLFARMLPYQVPGEAPRLNTREIRTAKVLAYLVGWSLTDGERPGDGLPVPMAPEMSDTDRINTLRNLDPDIFTEIHQAIDAHERAMDAARAAEKKTAGRNGPDVISASPSAAAGPSPLSVN